MKRLLVILLLILTKQISGQDVEFSQYYANPIYLNPAFAGSEDYTRVALNYKALLPSSYGNYSIYSASIDKYYDELGGGIGFQIMNDRQAQGVINNLSLGLVYSYHIRLKKNWSLNAGLKLGYNINTVNGNNLIMTDMIDPSTGVSGTNSESGLYQKSLYFDFSAGILSWYDRYYFGVSVDHLTKPQISLGSDDPGPIYRKYTFHGGVEIPFINTIYKEYMTLSPNIIYQQQGKASKINLGLYLNRNALSAGLWLRSNTQLNFTGAVFMLGYITDYSTFAYSYDIPFYLNGVNGVIYGSHEVTFLYKFKYKSKRKKMKAIKCPNF
jgi:type IX secretion system PorP/SprF family membrane protein